jgi:large subunit ribosomal protein L3
MINIAWGKKVGMSHVFSYDESGVSIPVTVVLFENWYVLQKVSRLGRCGKNCCSLQIGLLRKRFSSSEFSNSFLKNKKKHFLYVKEVPCSNLDEFSVGSKLQSCDLFSIGDVVSVKGVSSGKGFQGVVKRHGFSGGPASHGSCLGRRPGAISWLRTQGIVFKGKKLPGRMGGTFCTVRKLNVVKIDRDKGFLAIKGSIPGKAGGLVCINKGV